MTIFSYVKRTMVLFPLLAVTVIVSHRARLRAADDPLPTTVVEPEEGDDDDDDPSHGGDWFLTRRVPPGSTEIPADRYNAARQHIAQMPRFSISAAGSGSQSWTPLGAGNIGGRTRSWVINPKDPKIMYVGSVSGGVWKTTDAGQTWVPLFDSQPVLNIGALAMDPSNPNVLYAGTGEYPKSIIRGVGIFKTTDGGATWQVLPSTAGFLFTNRIAVSTANPQHVYAATDTGIWKSTDAGANWTQTALNSTQALNGCRDMVMRTDAATDYLFASCYGKTTSADAAIWRNSDAAGTGTWAVVFTTPHMARTSLALAPSQQTTIYAMASSHGGDPHYEAGLLGIYRSTSSGDSGTWTTRVTNADSNFENTIQLTESQGLITTAYCAGTAAPDFSAVSAQGDYDNVLAVDPIDPNRVWAGGIDIFRSDDGGVNWGTAGRWQLGTIPRGQTLVDYPHADNHVIVFHPAYDGASNQTMYLGNDGGLIRTESARGSVSTGPLGSCADIFLKNIGVKWVDMNGSYPVTQFYHGFAYPGGLAYMGGAQDNSVIRGTDAAGASGWQIPNGSGDGASVALDPADANIVFDSKQKLSLDRAADGVTFNRVTNGISEDDTKFPFVAPLAMDPNEGQRLFLGGTVSLWRTSDSGANWTAAAPVEANSGVSAVAVSPADANTVLFGTNLGNIYRSTSALSSDNSKLWSSTRPRGGVVSSLTIDPANASIVYASYSSFKASASDAHVYKSIDGGITWKPSDGTGASALPDIPTFRLLPDPRNSSRLYLGSDLGIFVSNDGGSSWSQDANPFSNVIVEELAMDQGIKSNWLFAFTYGRGLYRVALPGAPATNCSYSVSPVSIAAGPFGGVFPVTITAPDGCAWAGIPGANPEAFSVQSPAQGSGNSTAFVSISPNFSGGSNVSTARSDAITIANTTIPVTQSNIATFAGANDQSSAATLITVPSAAHIDTRTFTTNPSDPVHSCTNSADYKTAWWRVTPASSGVLQARVSGRRYDIFGNSGFVITAYPQSTPAVELGCTQVPRDTGNEIDGILTFNVSGGTTYLIEVSATGPTPQDGGLTTLILTLGSADLFVSVTPGTATLSAGSGTQQQFTAQVANASNVGVRWSISPPLGAISPSGLYTPPVSGASLTMVTIKATSFTDPTKQSSATVSVLPVGAATGPIISLVANAFGGTPLIAPNSWVAIKGSGLAPAGASRIWLGPDFVNNQLPTQLDGVSVNVNGKSAFVYFISPTQVNILTPPDPLSGPVQVQLTVGGLKSNPVTVQAQPQSLSLFEFVSLNTGLPYVYGRHGGDNTIIGPKDLYPGLTTPVKPGENIYVAGNGFGPTNGTIVSGSLSQLGTLPAPLPVIKVGGIPAAVSFAGLVAVGTYQFNFTVPTNAPDGDLPITVTYNGQNIQPGLLISVQR